MTSIINQAARGVQGLNLVAEMAWLLKECEELTNPASSDSMCSLFGDIDHERFINKKGMAKSDVQSYQEDIVNNYHILQKRIQEVIDNESEVTWTDFILMVRDNVKTLEKIVTNLNTYSHLLHDYMTDSGIAEVMALEEIIQHELLTPAQIKKYLLFEESYNHFVRHYKKFAFAYNNYDEEVNINQNMQLMPKLILYTQINLSTK